MTTKYSVHLIDERGNGSYLKVRDRTSWSKRTAQRHASDMRALIAKGRGLPGIVVVDVENEFGLECEHVQNAHGKCRICGVVIQYD